MIHFFFLQSKKHAQDYEEKNFTGKKIINIRNNIYI